MNASGWGRMPSEFLQRGQNVESGRVAVGIFAAASAFAFCRCSPPER